MSLFLRFRQTISSVSKGNGDVKLMLKDRPSIIHSSCKDLVKNLKDFSPRQENEGKNDTVPELLSKSGKEMLE